MGNQTLTTALVVVGTKVEFCFHKRRDKHSNLKTQRCFLVVLMFDYWRSVKANDWEVSARQSPFYFCRVVPTLSCPMRIEIKKFSHDILLCTLRPIARKL